MLGTRAAALRRASGCAGLMLAVISASSCDEATPPLANDAPPAPGPTAHLPPKGSDALAPPDAGVPCDRTPKPADGICSRVRVSCGVLDPDCVYVMGTLEESVAGQDVLIDPQDPSDRAYGFGMQRAMAVHPKTGELWFTASSGSSGAPWGVYIHQVNKWADAINPQLTFQRRIATPRCPEQVSPFEHFLFADDGALAYICSGRPLGLVNILGQLEGFDMQLYEPLALGRDRAVFGGTTATATRFFAKTARSLRSKAGTTDTPDSSPLARAPKEVSFSPPSTTTSLPTVRMRSCSSSASTVR